MRTFLKFMLVMIALIGIFLIWLFRRDADGVPILSYHQINEIDHNEWTLSPEEFEAQMKYLADNGVETQIHYPIPPHKQNCYREWASLSLPVTEQIHSQELSIPCHQAMTNKEASYIADLLNDFR